MKLILFEPNACYNNKTDTRMTNLNLVLQKNIPALKFLNNY